MGERMKRDSSRGIASLIFLSLLGMSTAQGAAEVRTLDVDLAPRIEAAAERPDRFAVAVPHAISPANAGQWIREGETSTWRYSVRIPGAVSMSFHANRYRLPAGAVLTVRGKDGAAATYTNAVGANGGLWGRLVRGDQLDFELRVASRDESRVAFDLASLQAGYRGLGGGAADHPHFKRLQKARAASAASATCLENFDCHDDAQSAFNGDATAAIVIDGIALCTGTLINNLRSDGTPYLLTARHCQTGPGAGIVVYWDAAKPCGQPLGSIYDTTTMAYHSGSETVFEQQDVWLIRLSSSINAKNPYFAGWDSTGGAFVGGYSPHHAMGRSRQYARWFGQAHLLTLTGATLGVGYDSNFWGVVNDVGSVGSGSSGGGLFNAEHRLVGVGSMAYLTGGPGSDGVCPATPPPVPDGSTATALYIAMSAVWESNADTTSSTNPVTLKSLLDPDNTGARTAPGLEWLRDVSLTAASSSGFAGRPLRLTWSGGSATSCEATGGTAGDGWAGTLATSGSLEVIQYDAGTTNYRIRCSNGTRFAIRDLRVEWTLLPPSLLFGVSNQVNYLSASETLQWTSTVVPCTASGGRAGDGWAGAKAPRGAFTVTATQLGTATYTLTCGTGARTIIESVSVETRAPFASLEALANDVRVNEPIVLMQSGAGIACTRSGGAAGDGWAGSTDNYPRRVTAATAGTYRYTLSCAAGVLTETRFVDLTFTNAAPLVTLTPSATSSEVVPAGPVVDGSSNVVTFTWQSNVTPCRVAYDGPGSNDGLLGSGAWSDLAVGSVIDLQNEPGAYVYTVTCGAAATLTTATTTVQWLPQSPAVRMFKSFADAPVVAHEALQIAWIATVTPCVATGGVSGDGWAGAKTISGGTPVMMPAAGTYRYELACGSGASLVTTHLDLTVPSASVTILAHPAQRRIDTSESLQWRSTTSPCVLSGDWSGTESANYGRVVTATGIGTDTYTVRCGTGTFVEATTTITWVPLPTAEITVSASEVSVNQPVTLQWNSTGAADCRVFGPDQPDWAGNVGASGTRTITRAVPTSAQFGIMCDDAVDLAGVNWLAVTAGSDPFRAPTVNLTIDAPTRTVGETVTVGWTSTRAAGCRGSLGANGDGWPGALPVSGTRVIRVNAAGVYTWAITCEGAPPAALAQVSATFAAAPAPPPPPAPSPGGGGKGGGRIDWVLLALLGFIVFVHAARHDPKRIRLE
jgi:lysyl endopeptidase